MNKVQELYNLYELKKNNIQNNEPASRKLGVLPGTNCPCQKLIYFLRKYLRVIKGHLVRKEKWVFKV